MTTIDVPYDPEQVRGEFGWLWTGMSLGSRDWALVYTDLPDGIDAEPQIRVIEPDVGSDADILDHADHWAGRPYLPANPPTCQPGAALYAELRLAQGARLSTAWAQDDPDDAQRAKEAMSALMMRDYKLGRPDDEVGDALAACRDRLYELLRAVLIGACVCRHDGTPELQTLDTCSQDIFTPDVRALQAAEAAIGRGAACPPWLGDALDTWPQGGKATS